MRKRATLKDIAKALNVSITTVSRALNDKDDISPETKRAVVEVAHMLDYKPNAFAVSLRKRRTSNIVGVILPYVDHYFYSTILTGIINATNQKENLILIGESRHSSEKEAELIDTFIDYFVSGIIIAPTRELGSNQNFELIQKQQIPLCLIDRTFKEYNGNYVQYDDFFGGYTATEHLIKQGRRRIAHIRGDSDCIISTERYRGYRSALADYDVPFSEDLIRLRTQIEKEDGYQLMKDILHKNEVPPDGLFTVNDDLAAGAYEALGEAGIRIPENISVVGYSNSHISRLIMPHLTTIEQNGREMGKTALSILINSIEVPEKKAQKTFGAHLIIRDSSITKE